MSPQLDEIRATLESRAFLFDDPASYRAGCAEALRAVLSVLSERVTPHPGVEAAASSGQARARAVPR